MWPMKILRFMLMLQVILILAASSGYVEGKSPQQIRSPRQIIPLARGTLNSLLQSMSEGAKAVRLVVTSPFQQFRNKRVLSNPTTTTKNPNHHKHPKGYSNFDESEVHYHYDEHGNRIENPDEYFKTFQTSHQHSHTGDAAVVPKNILKEIELKEEMKVENESDFNLSHGYSAPLFTTSNTHNSINNFENFYDSSNDWKPVVKSKPVSHLHTSTIAEDNFLSFNKKPKKLSPIFNSVKHDSGKSYSYTHFDSPKANYNIDTSESKPILMTAGESIRVSNHDSFDNFFSQKDNFKYRDHQVSESTVHPVAHPAASIKLIPQSAALKENSPAFKPTTTTIRPSTTRQRITTQFPSRTTTKSSESGSSTDRPNYPEYYFNKPKPDGGRTAKPKFIPIHDVKNEEELFKGTLTQFPVPPKFIPQFPKYPKDNSYVVMGGNVQTLPKMAEKNPFKPKEKPKKQVEPKKHFADTYRKRYPVVRSPFKPEPTTTQQNVIPVISEFTTTTTSTSTTTTAPIVEIVTPEPHEHRFRDTKFKKHSIKEEPKQRIRPRPPVYHDSSNAGSSTSYKRTASSRGSVKFGARSQLNAEE